MAVPPVPVLDIAASSLDPGPPRLWIGPGLSRNPDHPHSHSLAGNGSRQSSPSGSTLLQDKENSESKAQNVLQLTEHTGVSAKAKANTDSGAIIIVLKQKTCYILFEFLFDIFPLKHNLFFSL